MNETIIEIDENGKVGSPFVEDSSLILNNLYCWLTNEREKIEPTTERWKALADVTIALDNNFPDLK